VHPRPVLASEATPADGPAPGAPETFLAAPWAPHAGTGNVTSDRTVKYLSMTTIALRDSHK
jgi:hypothetical protein